MNLQEYYEKWSLKGSLTDEEQLKRFKEVILTVLEECQKRGYDNEKIADELVCWIKMQIH